MRRIKVTSFGVIPLRKAEAGWEVLLIQHKGGHWSFPKGRPEEGEAPIDSASRELQEETGLSIKKLFEIPPFEENYIFRLKDSLIYKTVSYFLAEVEGDVKLQEEELTDSKWLPLAEARMQATFPEGKNLCTEVEQFLKRDGST